MASGTRWFSALCLCLLATNLSALPAPETVTRGFDENTTLSTELKPPPLPEAGKEGERHFAIFVINLYGVKNSTGETDAEVFENEIIEHAPDVLEPLATVLLVVEEDENNRTSEDVVDLEEFARDLEKEGYNVDRIKHGEDTKLIRVRLEDKSVEDVMEASSKSKSEKEKKVRTKRTLCLKCKRGGGGGGGGGGGCGGGGCPSMCGGGGCGGGQRYEYIPVVVPVQVTQARPQMHPQMHPQQQSCNTCGGGGGGGGSYAHAQSSSSAASWGKK